jgi:hypothetical protein
MHSANFVFGRTILAVFLIDLIVLKFKEMLKKISFILLVFPWFASAQQIQVTFLDSLTKKPLVGLQIFSDNGSFISNSDLKGVFEFDLSILKKGNIKKIYASNGYYSSAEYAIEIIPSLILLKKKDYIQLPSVSITPSTQKKYFTLKGYFRSWKLENGKLVKYADGLVDYLVPYAIAKNYNEGIEKYFTNYRSFNADSIKQKSRIISVSMYDGYLNTSIYKRDLLKRTNIGYYELKPTEGKMSIIFEEGKNVGYVFFDDENNILETNVAENFEGDEALKILFWKISGKSKEIERWTGSGIYRHQNYVFTNRKTMVKTDVKGKFNAVETVSEIFIDDDVVYDDKKPEKFTKHLDGDRSFYNLNYWDERLLKYPLPSEIKAQLIRVSENKNVYLKH